MHLLECITREKTYMVSNLYLKFSELQLLEGDDKPFGSLYGATSSARPDKCIARQFPLSRLGIIQNKKRVNT